MLSSQLPLAPLPFRMSGTVTARCIAASAAWSAAGQGLAAAAKNEIVTGVCALLAPHVPKASTQFTFAAVATEDLAIDGLLLPDLIARDFPPAAAE